MDFDGTSDGNKRAALRMKLHSSTTETYSPELPHTGGIRTPDHAIKGESENTERT